MSRKPSGPRPYKTSDFQSFDEFFPFYLKEHSNRTNKRLHVIGTTLFLILLSFCLLSGRYGYAALTPILAYSFAWVGHFVFEKNKPATFKHPIWSLMGDFKMLYMVYSGKIKF